MNKKSVISVMVVAILLTISLYFVGGTYARYIGEYDGKATVSVAKWAVKVNDQETTTLNLDFQREENENVIDGKIAPGTKLSAEAKIDLTDTEVAVELIAEVNEATLTQKLTDLGIDKDSLHVTISHDGTDNNASITEGSGSTAEPYIIKLPDNQAFTESNGIVGLKITIEWENIEGKNSVDTEAGKTAAESVEIPVKITVKQHIGE